MNLEQQLAAYLNPEIFSGGLGAGNNGIGDIGGMSSTEMLGMNSGGIPGLDMTSLGGGGLGGGGGEGMFGGLFGDSGMLSKDNLAGLGSIADVGGSLMGAFNSYKQQGASCSGPRRIPGNA